MVLKSVFSKVTVRYRIKFMLQDAIGSRSHKVRVKQLDNCHFMQCKAQIYVALTRNGTFAKYS